MVGSERRGGSAGPSTGGPIVAGGGGGAGGSRTAEGAADGAGDDVWGGVVSPPHVRTGCALATVAIPDTMTAATIAAHARHLR